MGTIGGKLVAHSFVGAVVALTFGVEGLVCVWTGVGEEEEHQHYQRLPTNCYLPPNIQIIIIILVDVTKQGQISVDVICQGHRELHVIQEIPSALANHAL